MKLPLPLVAIAILFAACEDITNPEFAGVSETGNPTVKLHSTGGLVGWWSGDVDGSDETGSHNGVLEGGLTGANSGGKRNGAFVFDGGNDGLRITNVPELDFTQESSFTFEAWINSFGPTSVEFQSIIATNYACSPTYQTLHYVDNQVHFWVRDANNVAAVVVSPAMIPPNTLHHVAAVREVGAQTLLKLYVDGALVATAQDLTTAPLALNTDDFIGRNFPCETTRQFNGVIDEAKIHLRALSDAEIQCAYTCDDELPLVSDVEGTPSRVGPSTPIELTARLDDSGTGNSVITGAEYQIDGGSFVSMDAADGTFDEGVEDVAATVPASSLSGMHEICVRGTDRCNNKSNEEKCITVVLDDLGPATSLTSAAPNPVQVGASVSLNAFVDDGEADGSTIAAADYSIDGGAFVAMGSTDGSFDETEESITATIPAFGATGVHDVCVRGVDVVGNAGPTECMLMAVFDPTAGFVTGAGLIESPVGAYVPDPLAIGMARFGFVSRYQKGTTVPSGDTQFIFRTVDLEFRSTSYEWLVIAGARAQFKGRGTIGGSGDYGFLLTGIDGQLSGGGGTDKFRIKIWDLSDGDSIVYDNKPGAMDSGNDATQIKGGQINIHSQ